MLGNFIVDLQVRIQDCVTGGPSEILPISRSGVVVVAKIWASKLGVRGGGGPPLDPHLIYILQFTLGDISERQRNATIV